MVNLALNNCEKKQYCRKKIRKNKISNEVYKILKFQHYAHKVNIEVTCSGSMPYRKLLNYVVRSKNTFVSLRKQ